MYLRHDQRLSSDSDVGPRMATWLGSSGARRGSEALTTGRGRDVALARTRKKGSENRNRSSHGQRIRSRRGGSDQGSLFAMRPPLLLFVIPSPTSASTGAQAAFHSFLLSPLLSCSTHLRSFKQLEQASPTQFILSFISTLFSTGNDESDHPKPPALHLGLLLAYL